MKKGETIKSNNPISYYIFMAWCFILIARPQDIFSILSPLRPALTIGIIAFVSVMIQNAEYRKVDVYRNPQIKLYLSLVAVMMISIPFAYYRGGAFKYLFTVYVNAIAFFYLFSKIVTTKEKLKDIVFLCCIAALLYSFYSLTKGALIGENRLKFGGMFDPNDLAYFIISFLPFNFIFLTKESHIVKRISCAANIIIGILVIIMTGSRGGFLALAIILICILHQKSELIDRKRKIQILIIVLIAAPIVISKIDISRLLSITDLSDDYNMSDETGRIQIWKRGLNLMLHNPISGVGVSCFSEAIGVQRKKEGLMEMWQAPHNSIIQIGTETGIVGMVIYFLLNYNAYKIFNRAKNQKGDKEIYLLGEVIKLGFLGNFSSSMFLSQAYSIYFVLFIAFSASMSRINK